jgi:hypothetical protein
VIVALVAVQRFNWAAELLALLQRLKTGSEARHGLLAALFDGVAHWQRILLPDV